MLKVLDQYCPTNRGVCLQKHAGGYMQIPPNYYFSDT